MKDRRTFIKQSLFATGALMTGSSFKFPEMPKSDLTLSLAEWSFNRALFGGKLDHLDFPALAKNEYGISVVEYVSGFFLSLIHI